MNNKGRSPGGDKSISRAKMVGNLFETITAGLTSASAVTMFLALVGYAYMDYRIYKGRKEMKKGGNNG